MTRLTLAVALLLALVANGCGDGDLGGSGREVTTLGLDLFNERVVGTSPGCITCHSLDENVTLVGPSLFGLGARAGVQVSGLSAAEYVRESIVDPDAYVVEGFGAGLMVSVWGETLTEEQIDSLVEALLDL